MYIIKLCNGGASYCAKTNLDFADLLCPTLLTYFSNETTLFVLLTVFLLACPSINSSKDDSKGTNQEAAEAMFFEQALTSKPL